MTDEERNQEEQRDQATRFTAEQTDRMFRELIRHHAAGGLNMDHSPWEIKETPAWHEALKRNDDETEKEKPTDPAALAE